LILLDQVSGILTRKENNASAIEAWEKSIKIQPSADAYTSKFPPFPFLVLLLHLVVPATASAYTLFGLIHTKPITSVAMAELMIDMASAYVMGQPPNPALAIKHLTSVSSISSFCE